MASGKSSLVNTFKTVLRDSGQIATVAPTQCETYPLVTHILHEVILQNQPGTKTIRVYDCPGFVDNTYTLRERVLEEDLKHVIDGNVMKGYKFQNHHGIQEDSGFYRSNPAFYDRMHCVLFVIDAKRFSHQDDCSLFFKIQPYLWSKNIPLRLILQKVDKLDLCGSGELNGIFWSRHMDLKVKLAKDVFGVQDCQILPIANYVQGTTQNITQDVLALLAIDNILREALSYIQNEI